METQVQNTSITFLNKTGDITITWDEQNHDKMVELVKRKMKEGYSFFTIKTIPVIGVPIKVKVTDKNVTKLDALVIQDEDFDRFAKQVDDADIATEVREGRAGFSQVKNKDFETSKRIRDAEEIRGKNAIAVRPVAGG